ncbi:MAG: ABC transporter ATP-binding protein [Candidatus Zixiibacteriota bacterium]
MGHPLIRTRELCRYYRRGPQEIRAVDRVTLDIPRGDFLAVVGASGSGKSTLLNLLAGLDSPTSGGIDFEGVPFATLSRRQRSAYRAHKVGMVFQSFNLIAHRTAVENVELALYFNQTLPRDRRQQATAILERLGLAERMTHRPADLSGGEQQRVAIARALVKRPSVLCVDEPTGNLDQDNARQVIELLAELNRGGQTIILVTHDPSIAACARRTIRMRYGQIVTDAGGAA